MPKDGISLIGHDDILSYEEIIRISRIAASKGISKIRITGGEPLVRKGIAGLISSLNEIPGIDDLSITTNGILLQSYASILKKAGLQRINVSLDTIDPLKYKKITRGGDLNEVLAGIKKAWDEGFDPVKINVVAMRGINDDEIRSFSELTIERPIHIRFIEFMPVDIKSGWDKNYFISNLEIKDKIKELGELIPISSDNISGPAKMFKIKGAKGKLGFISALSNHFCDTCNRLRLTADGKLRTCLFSDDETDLRRHLRDGSCDSELEQIITNAILSKPRKHKILEPSFKKCYRGMSAIGG
jgi:cyclic pyranopterin phosphate synthase